MSTPAGWKQGPGKDWACPVCLAQNHPSAPRCWQCQSERKTEPDPLADPLLDPVAPAPARPRISNQAVVGVYLVLVAASVVVIEWFARQSSDMGKIAAIVLGLALLSTALLGGAARLRGRARPAESIAFSFLKSLIVTVMIITGLIVLAVLALVIGLFLMCTGAIRGV